MASDPLMDLQTSIKSPDWNNLAVIHRNVLPPRSSFWNYESLQDALTMDPARALIYSLSGMWKFKLYHCPFDMPNTPAEELVGSPEYCDIAVPGMWQLQGHGQGPRYTNMSLPFPVDPPHVPLFENETGHYVRKFEIPESFAAKQIRLRFEGVDAAFHVYINGHEVGYSQGSRNPSEFDISPYVKANSSNNLAVIVYQKCDGTYLEDQDQWWLSGIFRDVYLLAFPESRIEDAKIETLFDKDYRNAVLSVNVSINTAADITLDLLNADSKTVASETQKPATGGHIDFRIDVQSPHKWTAEDPYLYYAVLRVGDGSQQTIVQRVGFRQVDIRDGVILVNGSRVVFRGINRHEHHPKFGRAVPYEFMRNDLIQMKKHNINAIRTAHYPNDPRLYDLADTLGFWIMDEADLESHGFSYVELAALTEEDKKLSKKGVISLECGRATEWITNKPEWEESFVDRARQLVMRDKNHPSVIIWSLGNESYHGKNTTAAYNWVKAHDPTRPIHYEGDREAEVVDMYSLMYPEIPEVLDLERTSPLNKPIILCEYLYGIGNGAGAIKEYIELLHSYPRIQGMFAWQWASQGLEACTAEGELFYGYGGDFGDIINDGREMTHGFNFSDHTPKPALLELKKALEPIQVVKGDLTAFSFINRYDFANLDHLKCEWWVVGDGFCTEPSEVALPSTEPGAMSEVILKGARLEEEARDFYVNISFRLRNPTLWAPAGYEVAGGEFLVQGSSPKETVHSTRPAIQKLSSSVLEIKGSSSTWTFDCLRGEILSWAKNGVDLITSSPKLSFYRAMTDNDELSDGVEWSEKLLKHVKPYTKAVGIESTENGVVLTVSSRAGPIGLEWGINLTITYIFSADRLDFNVDGVPFGVNAPKTLARIGLEFGLSSSLDQASWFGRGPGESYRDRKLSQRVGNWSLSLDKLFTALEYPQESGNRSDIRWVSFQGLDETVPSIKADFATQDGCSFSALYFDALDIDRCKHPWELYKMKKKNPVVRLDWAHHGLGTGAIGPKTLPKYALLNQPFNFKLALE